MRKNWLLFLLAALTLLLAFSVLGCGDDDDDNNDADDDSGADDDSAADDDAADDDSAVDDDTQPDDDTGTDVWTGNETIIVSTPDGPVTVELNGLPAFTWNDPDDGLDKTAVYLSVVVEQAFSGKEFDPADYKYNFLASDGYNILSQKLDGDYRALPSYADLEKGWFIEYEEEGGKYIDIEVVWDDSLGFSNFMGAKMMDGGTIEMVENILFDQSVTVEVVWATSGAKTAVDLNGLPAFDDGGTLAVYLHLIIWEAALEDFDPKTYTYAFNFISNDDDGNWSLLDNLSGIGDLPVWLDYETNKDIHHGWIEDAGEDGYRLFWDEATGFTGMYSVKFMNGGTIEVYDVTE